MDPLIALLVAGAMAWFLVKVLPKTIADFVAAKRGERPSRGDRRGLSGFLSNWWDDAWDAATNWRRNAGERRANRPPVTAKPGLRRWLSTWFDNRVASKWRDRWEAAIGKEVARRRGNDDPPLPYGPCQWCGKPPLAPRIRDTSVYGHLDEHGRPWCAPTSPDTGDGDGVTSGEAIPEGLDRACVVEDCGGTRTPVEGTAAADDDGHMRADAACDTCGARYRVWWCPDDPSAHGSEIIPPTGETSRRDDNPGRETAADHSADPATSSQQPHRPAPGLRAERDGIPLDVQLLEPVPTTGGSYEYQEVQPMSEITGLTSAIQTTGLFGSALDDTASQAEAMAVGLEGNGVTGEGPAALRRAQEMAQQAAEAFRAAESELKSHLGVKEAYEATPGAGHDAFVRSE